MPRLHRFSRSPLSFRPAFAESLEQRTLLSVAPATLVKDINTAPVGIVTRDPFSFIPFKGMTYFRATAGDTGTEWFRTDGTAPGTTLLADIVPGIGSSFREEGGLFTKQMTTAAVVGDTLLFAAYTPTTGTELWKTDGTEAGTLLVKDIYPGQQSGIPEWFTTVGDTLYFSAQDRNLNRQLWKSDGTPEGTQPVTSFPTGVNVGSLVYPIAPLNGKLLFAGNVTDPNDVYGVELYSTDGTAGGTTLLKNINPNGGSNPGVLLGDTGNLGGQAAIVSGTMYFAATDQAHGRELWKTDGTSAGTVMVQDLRPGPNGGAPSRLVAAGGSVYFVAAGLAGTGQTTPIYRTDPATGAPSKIGEVELRFPQFATDGSADGAFYIVGWHAPNSALYKYDPANPAAGLTLVADLVNLNHPRSQRRRGLRRRGAGERCEATLAQRRDGSGNHETRRLSAGVDPAGVRCRRPGLPGGGNARQFRHCPLPLPHRRHTRRQRVCQ
jgi:ELWxxDGT repeat protein